MMMRILSLVLAVLLMPTAALALQQSSVPPKFPIPWANNAGSAYVRTIPAPSQIGVQNCAASLFDGFPPLTFIPSAAGGCPPFGQDFNGVLRQITQWSQWAGAGAAPLYDSSFSSLIGGYPSGATLANASTPGCFWVSTVDNNSSNPDASGANWSTSCPGGGVGGTSTASANSQVIALTPFVRAPGARIMFTAGFTNTGPLQVNDGAGLKNVVLPSLGALSGGEVVAGQIAVLAWDGTQYELQNSAAYASLTAPGQTLTGGAIVPSLPLSVGSQTVNCSLRPLQYVANASSVALAFTAPTSDGNCQVQVENGAGAVLPTFSGFSTNGSTGDPFTTVNGSFFVITFWRNHGKSSYLVKALQ